MGPIMEGETLHRCTYAFVCIHTHTERERERERETETETERDRDRERQRERRLTGSLPLNFTSIVFFRMGNIHLCHETPLNFFITIKGTQI